MPQWAACLVGAVVAILVAILLAPYIPEPGGHIVAIICYVAAVILAIFAVFSLVRSRGV